MIGVRCRVEHQMFICCLNIIFDAGSKEFWTIKPKHQYIKTDTLIEVCETARWISILNIYYSPVPLTAPLRSTFNPTYRLHSYTTVTKSFILQIFLKPSALIDRNIWGKYIIVFLCKTGKLYWCSWDVYVIL